MMDEGDFKNCLAFLSFVLVHTHTYICAYRVKIKPLQN